MEKGSKGALTEIVSVLRSFARFRPLQIELADGRRAGFDSLVFANIAQMAKYATLSETELPAGLQRPEHWLGEETSRPG